MRKLLTLLTAIFATVAITATAAAAVPKSATLDQTTATSSIHARFPGDHTDIGFQWAYHGSTVTRWMYEADMPFDGMGGVFRSSQLTWATVTLDYDQECRYSDPPDPGSDPDDSCLLGHLVASLRWDAHGNRHRLYDVNGVVRGYYKNATVSGSITWNGETLVEWTAPVTGRIERYLTG